MCASLIRVISVSSDRSGDLILQKQKSCAAVRTIESSSPVAYALPLRNTAREIIPNLWAAAGSRGLLGE